MFSLIYVTMKYYEVAKLLIMDKARSLFFIPKRVKILMKTKERFTRIENVGPI